VRLETMSYGDRKKGKKKKRKRKTRPLPGAVAKVWSITFRAAVGGGEKGEKKRNRASPPYVVDRASARQIRRAFGERKIKEKRRKGEREKGSVPSPSAADASTRKKEVGEKEKKKKKERKGKTPTVTVSWGYAVEGVGTNAFCSELSRSRTKGGEKEKRGKLGWRAKKMDSRQTEPMSYYYLHPEIRRG